MNEAKAVHWLFLSLARSLTGCAFVAAIPASAALAHVNVVDFAFSPTNTVVNVNDDVAWAWLGTFLHSTTSTTGLWDSGLHSTGFNYTNTFKSAGNFPYICSLHRFAGSVTVKGQAQTNAPPTVAITSPANASVFAAPWTGTIQATVSDSDGTVTNIDFLAGPTLLERIANPPANPSITVTNLAAGDYALTAVATDNGGATSTSTAVTISVVAQPPITISSPQRLTVTSFQFSYSVAAGINYVVERSPDLVNWNSLATNNASSSPATFTDNNASGAVNFYRVKSLSNP